MLSIIFCIVFWSAFNLGTWLSTKGYAEPLTGDQTSSLMRELGMDQFVELTCGRNGSFYQPETSPGWKVEPGTSTTGISCEIWVIILFISQLTRFSKIIHFFFPDCYVEPVELWENDTNCYINSNCSLVSCCLDDEVTGKSFQVSLEVLRCDRKVLVTLERRTFILPLQDYADGTTHSIRLFGVLILE